MRVLSVIFFVLIFACNSKPIGQKIVFPENHYLINNGGCMYRDSLEVKSSGKNLFADKAGNLYFKTADYSDDVDSPVPVLISRLYNGCDGDSAYDLKHHIDPTSFTDLGFNFYKDKKNVFFHNAMSDGGNIIKIDEADPGTFILYPNSQFASDKERVYYKGSLVEMADKRTFSCIYRIIDGDTSIAYFGKDKRFYFSWFDTCSKKQVDEYLKK